MSNYVIGIGGTGAKCVEAFVHMVAAGLVNPSDRAKDISVLLIDPDVANGSLERARSTLQKYREVRTVPSVGRIAFLRDGLEPVDRQKSQWAWSPFADEANPSFQRRFTYAGMGVLEAGLLDVLYTDAEKKASLRKGFLGRPSIGAAVMAEILDLDDPDLEEPWKGLSNRLKNDKDPKVFIVGSIFGGTGASGMPTVARLLADFMSTSEIRIGCALVLPYFSFPAPDAQQAQQVQARAEEFLLRSQAALSYYQSKLSEDRDIYDAVYLLGTDDLPQVENNSLGSKEQRNPPHYLELYAATAALHFFEQQLNDPVRTHIIRSPGVCLNWSQLPGGKVTEYSLANLARFSYAYLGYFYKELLNPAELQRKKAPWFGLFFKKERLSEIEVSLKKVRDYCELFLVWLKDTQSFSGNCQVDLFRTDTYRVEADSEGNKRVSILKDEYIRLYAVESSQSRLVPNTFLDIKVALDRLTPEQSVGASDVGCFIHALYKLCSPKKEL
ncbi:MAG: hypothetical protein H7Y37_06410 [Anaerolineae bacterium]|nr:hypothetical protein [Gloeobacterales cyanobacterium ES-bin-313]